MLELAGSLYLVSTAAFAGMALVVGVRLLLLWRSTRQIAECLLGLGVMLTAALGYGVMMVGIIGRGFADDPANAPAIYAQITTTGWVFHNLGVVCMLLFVVRVFRPDALWARCLAGAATVVLWAGWFGYVGQGGITSMLPTSGYWVAFSVIGTYPLWTAVESFLYWGQMRKRLALGLADGLVTNRFLLWSLASLSAAGSIWLVNVPTLLGYVPNTPESEGVTAVSMLATSILGISTVSIYWLTFVPPRWYRARFEAASGP